VGVRLLVIQWAQHDRTPIFCFSRSRREKVHSLKHCVLVNLDERQCPDVSQFVTAHHRHNPVKCFFESPVANFEIICHG
jgi:hypothetical protein